LVTTEERERKQCRRALSVLQEAHRTAIRTGEREVYDTALDVLLEYADARATNNAIEQIRKLETEGTIETLPPKEDDNGPSAFPRFKKSPQPKPQQQGAVPPVGFKFDPRLIFTESGYCLGYKDE
jgi:hypothetical protein